MSIPAPKPRLHLVAAREAPRAVVFRRGPSKLFHIMTWNTRTHEIEHGSWFRGKLYWHASDISFDGRWLYYLALGADGVKWNGICEPPRLRTMVEWDVEWGNRLCSGGLWIDRQHFLIDECHQDGGITRMPELRFPQSRRPPFEFAPFPTAIPGQPPSSWLAIMERDGWLREGPMPSLRWDSSGSATNFDPGWSSQPTPAHPVLRRYLRGFHRHEYWIESKAELLGPDVDSATWDAIGQLLVARDGRIECYTVENIVRCRPGFVYDLTGVKPPPLDAADDLSRID